MTVFYLDFDRDRLFYACYNYRVKSEQQRADGRKPGRLFLYPADGGVYEKKRGQGTISLLELRLSQHIQRQGLLPICGVLETP